MDDALLDELSDELDEEEYATLQNMWITEMNRYRAVSL